MLREVVHIGPWLGTRRQGESRRAPDGPLECETPVKPPATPVARAFCAHTKPRVPGWSKRCPAVEDVPLLRPRNKAKHSNSGNTLKYPPPPPQQNTQSINCLEIKTVSSRYLPTAAQQRADRSWPSNGGNSRPRLLHPWSPGGPHSPLSARIGPQQPPMLCALRLLTALAEVSSSFPNRRRHNLRNA